MKLLVACVVVVIAVLYFYDATQIFVSPFSDPNGPRAFPFLLSGLLVLGGLGVAAEWWFERAGRTPKTERAPLMFWPLVPVAAWTLLYAVTFELVGFIAGTVLYLAVLLSIFNRGRHALNALIAICFPVFLYVMMNKVLGGHLPDGSLFVPLLNRLSV